MTLKNGLVVMTPSSVVAAGTGSSASIDADGSVVFSSCTSLSLNGVFTSSYDNYMITLRSSSSNAARSYKFRLRASGTDNSTANSYASQYVEVSGASASSSRATGNEGVFGYSNDTLRSGVSVFIFGPQLAQPTVLRSVGVSAYLNSFLFSYASTHNQSTSYDGISIYDSSGTLSGLLTVFGFNQ